MKRWFPAAAGALLLLACLSSSALASPGSTLTPTAGEDRLQPGDTVAVSLAAADRTADVAAWEARVYYDPAVFAFASASLTEPIYCDPTVQTDRTGTYITLSVIDPDGAASLPGGSLGSISFRALPTAAEDAFARFGSRLTAYYDAHGCSAADSPLRWSGPVSVQAHRPVGEGSIPGDANNDGAVDALDARLVLRWTAGLAAADEIDLGVTDVDGSGTTDALDAALILRYVSGKLAAFPAQPAADGAADLPEAAARDDGAESPAAAPATELTGETPSEEAPGAEETPAEEPSGTEEPPVGNGGEMPGDE